MVSRERESIDYLRAEWIDPISRALSISRISQSAHATAREIDSTLTIPREAARKFRSIRSNTASSSFEDARDRPRDTKQ